MIFLNLFLHTAEQLIYYDDILDPSKVYSLLGVAAASARAFGLCSRAFIKLESIETVNDEDRHAYQELALQIFSR